MADQKITELTELTSGQIADTDVLPIVDVDADATKKWTWASVKADILSWIGAVNATFTNKTIDADNNTITNIGTSELSDEGVTLAKMAHIATNRILGRETTGTGDVEALTATQVRTIINVENGADVTDTANVTAAGALMDSEVTDLAGIKALQTSTLQLKPLEGAFVDGDKTKLDGIETGADVTDAANVISALNGAAITVGVVATTDKLLWQDADDSDALKYATVQSILDLGSGGAFSTDGNGAYYNGAATIGANATSTQARLVVAGAGSTSATNAIIVENSSGTDLFSVKDDGQWEIGVNNEASMRALSNNDLYVFGAYTYWQPANRSGFGAVMYIDASHSSLSVNNGSARADNCAVLHLTSTTRGFLPPRMTGAQVEAISTPIAGLIAYATSAGAGDVTAAGWWGWNGSNWVSL